MHTTWVILLVLLFVLVVGKTKHHMGAPKFASYMGIDKWGEYDDIMSETLLTPSMLETFARGAVKGNLEGRENTWFADWGARLAQQRMNQKLGRINTAQYDTFASAAGIHICDRQVATQQHWTWRHNPLWNIENLSEKRIHTAYKELEKLVERLLGTWSIQPSMRKFHTDLVWRPLRSKLVKKWQKQWEAEVANEQRMQEIKQLYQKIVHLRALMSIIHFGAYVEDDRIDDGSWKACLHLDKTSNHRKPLEVAVVWGFDQNAPIVNTTIDTTPLPILKETSQLTGWGGGGGNGNPWGQQS